MLSEVSSRAHTEFHRRLTEEIQVLEDIVRALTGSGRGKREERLNVLHLSGIVLLTAAFEGYIEAVVGEAAELLSSKIKSPSTLPIALKRNVVRQSGESKKGKHELFAWGFAEEGWREMIMAYIRDRVERFNTPNSKNIRLLFFEAFGIEDVTSVWGRSRMNAATACATLDTWLARRHTIVHGLPAQAVLSDVRSYRNFLLQTVKRTDRALEDYLRPVLPDEDSVW